MNIINIYHESYFLGYKMPEVARKDGTDQVNTVHNAIGKDCAVAPKVIATDKGSSTVFAEGVGVVRVGDAVERHDQPGCVPHAPPLASGSSSVFADGKAIGRKGDTYGGGEKILSGAPTVIAG
jgi:uncharacterized Zn-binding protein involved in type VI secretion